MCNRAVVAVCAALPLACAALPPPEGELEQACWQRYTAERTRINVREPTIVEFSNLRSGYRVRTPFLVEFAVRGMGVVPAGTVLDGTGHHHILVDQPLPHSVTEKIPFSDRHRHFGKGQTSTVLDLAPGQHTLRLLFADHDHRPYFVFSPEIVVQVVGRRGAETPRIDPARFAETCAAWYEEVLTRPRVPPEPLAITNVVDGETLASPFNVRFSVDGYGVCAAGVRADRCGHFMMDVLQDGRPLRTVDLSNGATQTNLGLPNGRYRLRLRFVDGATRKDLLPAAEIAIVVRAQERL